MIKQNFSFTLGSNNSLLKSFIEKFTRDEFFIDLIRLVLYPADFGNINSNKIVDYLKSFLNDINLVIRKTQFGLKSSTESIALVNSLLNIRESHTNILNYDNVFQHLGNCSLYTQQLIQKAIDNKIVDPDVFRRLKENILLTTQAYYEIYSVSGNIKLLDILTESISKDTVPVFEALRNYKDVIINAYNDLSKLQSLNKKESISDYFIKIMPPSSEYVLNKVNKTRIYAPDGNNIELRIKTNYVIDRKKFDNYLAKKAIQANAKIRLGYFLTDLKEENKKYVLFFKNKKSKADIVIGADGPLTIVGKKSGLFNNRRFLIGTQVEAYFKKDNVVDFYPYIGAYAWIVPLNSKIRKGVASYKNSRTLFKRFIKKFNLNIIENQSGLIPIFDPFVKVQKNGMQQKSGK